MTTWSRRTIEELNDGNGCAAGLRLKQSELVKAEKRKTGKPILPVVPVEGVPLRRFTLDEYHELIKIDFFDEGTNESSYSKDSWCPRVPSSPRTRML